MESLKEKAVAEFDMLSGYYDSFTVSWFFKPFYKKVGQAIRDIPHQRILSVGCGTATLELTIARTFPEASVVGLDLSPGMLKKARVKGRGISNLSFVEGDAEQLPLEANSFDLILCSHSFHHYPNKDTALSEMRRVLTTDGTLILVEGLKDSFIGKVWLFLIEHIFEPGVEHFSKAILSDMLVKAGFSTAHFENILIGYALVKARP